MKTNTQNLVVKLSKAIEIKRFRDMVKVCVCVCM